MVIIGIQIIILLIILFTGPIAIGLGVGLLAASGGFLLGTSLSRSRSRRIYRFVKNKLPFKRFKIYFSSDNPVTLGTSHPTTTAPAITDGTLSKDTPRAGFFVTPIQGIFGKHFNFLCHNA